MPTINTKTYSLDRSTPDANTYTGPGHTFSQSDKLELKRVYPKAGSDGFRGVARPTVKLTRSVVVNPTTGERRDAIVTLSASLPVGMTDVDVQALLADITSAGGHVDVKALFLSLDINAA